MTPSRGIGRGGTFHPRDNRKKKAAKEFRERTMEVIGSDPKITKLTDNIINAHRMTAGLLETITALIWEAR